MCIKQSQDEQRRLRWFFATVLLQDAHFSGPGFGLISPLSASRFNWNVDVELEYLVNLKLEKPLAGVLVINFGRWKFIQTLFER